MYLLYSILLSIGLLIMFPLFLLRREKYASGFSERLGNYPEFKHDEREVIWLHCVSVGETNAARPLIDELITKFPRHRLVISTVTRTGQELARKLFSEKADSIFYLPFDWKLTVRRALDNYRPSLVLLMETEIWPMFIREAKRSGAMIAIVNGRLSERSLRRYMRVRSFVKDVLDHIDLALMQADADAERFKALGIDERKVVVTGNLKFEQASNANELGLTDEFRSRFGVVAEKPIIVAASTHEPEERYVIEALDGELGISCRLMIAPRHPERFDSVQQLLRKYPYSFVRRSAEPSAADKTAGVILLDSIGELRAAYPLADIVFVGGSLIPHGGQSVLEPAVEGKAIVTGPYTHNFDAVVKEFRDNDAIRQTRVPEGNFPVSHLLREQFDDLLSDPESRARLGANAAAIMGRSNRAATEKTIEYISTLISGKTDN